MSDIKVADGLSRIVQYAATEVQSRCFSLTLPSSLQVHDIYAEMDRSVQIQGLIAKISRGETAKIGYAVIQGRLYYKGRLVLPSDSLYIKLILKEYHDRLLGGHSGILKTLKRICDVLYWRNMRKHIQEYVAACEVCQTRKYITLSPAGLLQPIDIPKQIWEDISMEFIVMVDRLSKYSHFMTLKHPFIASDVAQKFIQEIVRLHGYALSIISDRYKFFLSSSWKDCFKASGTQLHFSTAFNPQNGWPN